MTGRDIKERTAETPAVSKDPAIDMISFDRRRRAESIRQNEEAAREKRRREIEAKRRAERIRRAKIERLKALILFSVCGIGALCVAIGVIVSVVKAVSSPKDNAPEIPTGAVSAEESARMDTFAFYSGNYYTAGFPENAAEVAFLKNASAFLDQVGLSENTALGIPLNTVKLSEFGALAKRLAPYSTTEGFASFKNSVKNAPIFSNGYVWSEMESIKSTLTGGYLYDTNPSYITAISEICLWEGDGGFLSEVDNDTQPKLDKSQGKTVLQKLEMATNYLFDGKIEEGGLKYDPISGLCYIHTPENNGSSSGFGSNIWYNFRFGYLDAYTNVQFGKAMQSLAALYNMLGEKEKADGYMEIFQKNAAAFNEKFWDSTKGRYVGCIDKNGVVRDYGFTFINLEAIEAGYADDDKATLIFAWLDGTREIAEDTSKGADIYAYAFAPRTTTVPAEDIWWDYAGGKLPLSTEGAYDAYYQNGGVALSSAYYDIAARLVSGNTALVTDKMQSVLTAFADGLLASGGASVRVGSDALSGLVPGAIRDAVFGVSTDGLRLCVSPNFAYLPETKENSTNYRSKASIGIKNIAFARNSYNLLFTGDGTFITAVSKKPVRMRIGGFDPQKAYELVTVESGIETERLALTVSADGNVDLAAEFGNTSYVKIVEVKQEKQKK